MNLSKSAEELTQSDFKIIGLERTFFPHIKILLCPKNSSSSETSFQILKYLFQKPSDKEFSYLACKRENECPIFLPLFLSQGEM